MAATAPEVFVRKASGVVRAWGTLDMWMYNSVIPIGWATFMFSLAAFGFPNGQHALAILVTTAFFMIMGAAYAMLAAAMPRTGGDYTWQTRVLGGATGFTLNFGGIMVIECFFQALVAMQSAYIAFGPIFSIYGLLYSVPWAASLGSWLVTPEGIFVFSIPMSIWFVIINIAGMKWYARAQKIMFTLAIISFVISIALFLTTTTEAFRELFNSFMSSVVGYQSPDAYHDIINIAVENGFSPDPPKTLWGTMSIIPIAAFYLMYPSWGAWNQGELRNANSLKVQIITTVGATFFGGVVCAILITLIEQSLGTAFFNASAFAFFSGLSPNPIPAMWPNFVAIMSWKSPAVMFWLLISLSLLPLCMNMNCILGTSRAVMAAAFDRILPTWMASVNRRTHTPIKSILVIWLAGVFFAYLYTYTAFWTLTLDAGLGTMTTYAFTMLAAALLPFWKRELWKASPGSKYRIGSVPIITVCAVFVIAVVYSFLMYMWITVDFYGLNNALSAAFIVSIFVGGILIYWVSKKYRMMREDFDLSLVFKEIPPE